MSFFSLCLNFRKEIHNKITSIGFEDCKVFIHSVDAQSSANGGIIIQVIGEMSNRGEPWRKFVQTFFLAEQPNGYFVLNDIFRFLKEESVESDEGEQEQSTIEAEQVSAPSLPEADPPLSPQSVSPTLVDVQAPEPVQTASPIPSAAPAEEASPAPESPVAEPYANGHADIEHEVPEILAPAPREKSPTPEPESSPTVESPAPAASPAPPPAASPVPSQPPAPVAPSQPAQPPAPPVPKTWANLAAANLKKWGSAVAQESRGTSEAPAASSSSPGSGTQTPVSHHGPGSRPQQQQQQREPHPAYVAATSVANPQCFVKVRSRYILTCDMMPRRFTERARERYRGSSEEYLDWSFRSYQGS